MGKVLKMTDQRSRPFSFLRQRGSGGDAPTTEAEFLNLVYAGEFSLLTDLFAAGRLGKFEAHPFTPRVVQHGLLETSSPEIQVTTDLAGRKAVLTLSGKWPDDARINSAYWSVSSARQSIKEGVIDRRASSHVFSEELRLDLSPRFDVHVVLGIRTRGNTFAGSSHRFVKREGLRYEGKREDRQFEALPRIEYRDFSFTIKKSRLSLIPLVLGLLAISVSIAYLIFQL